MKKFMHKIAQVGYPFKKNGKHTYNNRKLFEWVHNNYMTLSQHNYYK